MAFTAPLKNLSAFITNLNADDTSTAEGTVPLDCGTLALITKLINDLADLRTDLKLAEKSVENILLKELTESQTHLTGSAVIGDVTPNIVVQSVLGSGDYEKVKAGSVQPLTASKFLVKADGTGLVGGNEVVDLLTARTCTATNLDGGGANNVGFLPASDGEAMPEAVVFNHLAEMYGLLRSLMRGTPATADSQFSSDQATTRA